MSMSDGKIVNNNRFTKHKHKHTIDEEYQEPIKKKLTIQYLWMEG